MPITKKQSPDGVELFVAGRIDGAAANELEISILEASREGVKTIYVNLSEVTNVIEYAWDDSEEHGITLRFQVTEQEVSVEIEDDGRPYDPRTAPLVDIHTPLETRAVGGLGIHLIRQLMDEVNYRRENERNILTLTKRIA